MAESDQKAQRKKQKLHKSETLSSVWCVCVQAMQVERAMSSELQALKQELQRKGSVNRLQDEELISAMREQVICCIHKAHTL